MLRDMKGMPNPAQLIKTGMGLGDEPVGERNSLVLKITKLIPKKKNKAAITSQARLLKLLRAKRRQKKHIPGIMKGSGNINTHEDDLYRLFNSWSLSRCDCH